MKKSLIAQILSVLLKIIFITGIVGLFFVPKLYNLFSEINFANQTVGYQIAFYGCYILSLFIIFELIRIFDTVYKGSPFKKEIEISLKVIAVLFMVISMIVITKTIFITTILSIAVSFISFIISLCFYVLSQIFKVAIEYKNEIDFTV